MFSSIDPHVITTGTGAPGTPWARMAAVNAVIRR
jgi:hypothetical protein